MMNLLNEPDKRQGEKIAAALVPSRSGVSFGQWLA
jgi:hypothetical protein